MLPHVEEFLVVTDFWGKNECVPLEESCATKEVEKFQETTDGFT